jgi:hypothetical protein
MPQVRQGLGVSCAVALHDGSLHSSPVLPKMSPAYRKAGQLQDHVKGVRRILARVRATSMGRAARLWRTQSRRARSRGACNPLVRRAGSAPFGRQQTGAGCRRRQGPAAQLTRSRDHSPGRQGSTKPRRPLEPPRDHPYVPVRLVSRRHTADITRSCGGRLKLRILSQESCARSRPHSGQHGPCTDDQS